MATYTQSSVKRQKIRESSGRFIDTNEYFHGINKIEHKPDATNVDTFHYRYYNAIERIGGRSMEDWIKPTISYKMFTFKNSSSACKTTVNNTWDDGSQSIDNYKRKLKAAFELYVKLGIKYWTVSDRELAPEGETWEETNKNLDEVAEFLLELQQKSGIKLLYIFPDFTSNIRYNNGAATSNNPLVYATCGQQVKKCLELAHKFGAEAFLYKGSYEGYDTTMNTDLSKELKHFSRILKNIVEYKDQIGYRGQLLFECKKKRYRDNTRFHQYCYDVQSSLHFLKYFNLERYYKLNITNEYDFFIASVYGTIGSISFSEYPTFHDAVSIMRRLLEREQYTPGGILISPCISKMAEPKDFIENCIMWIDRYAKALRIACKMQTDDVFDKYTQETRNDNDLSRQIHNIVKCMSAIACEQHYTISECPTALFPANLQECDEFVKKSGHGNPHSNVYSNLKKQNWFGLLERYADSI